MPQTFFNTFVKEETENLIKRLDQLFDEYLCAYSDYNGCHLQLRGHHLPSQVEDRLWWWNDIIENIKDELRDQERSGDVYEVNTDEVDEICTEIGDYEPEEDNILFLAQYPNPCDLPHVLHLPNTRVNISDHAYKTGVVVKEKKLHKHKWADITAIPEMETGKQFPMISSPTPVIMPLSYPCPSTPSSSCPMPLVTLPQTSVGCM